MIFHICYHILTSLSSPEFHTFVEVCEASPMFQKKIKEFRLPEGFEVIIEVSLTIVTQFGTATR